MSNKSKAVKGQALATTTMTANEDHGTKADSLKAIMADISVIEKATKTYIQGVAQYQSMLAECARKCALHVAAFGDARPADKFIKALGMRELRTFRDELVAWFRLYTPIRWDANGKVSVERDKNGNVKATNTEKVKEEAFFESALVTESRKAAGRAAAAALKPVTLKDILGRINGLRKFLQSANQPNAEGHVRGIDKSEGAKIRKVVDAVEEATHDVVGSLFVPEGKAVNDRAAKRDKKKAA